MMKIIPILAIALCLIASPLVPSFYIANAQEPATQFQWIAGFLAETFEAAFALIETIVSILRSPVEMPLCLHLTVNAIEGALGFGIIGVILGVVLGTIFGWAPGLILGAFVGLVFPIPLVSWILTAPLGTLIGIFGMSEPPEGMQPPDIETIKGWAEINPFENVSH